MLSKKIKTNHEAIHRTDESLKRRSMLLASAALALSTGCGPQAVNFEQPHTQDHSYSGPAPIMPRAIAHRGLVGTMENGHIADQNTTESCINAIEQGANECEYDIRFSKDGVPFLMHYSLLQTTTDCDGKPGSISAKMLERDCRTEHGDHVPTLDEFLKTISEASDTITFQQEIKSSVIAPEQLATILGLIKKYNLEDRITITSKYFEALETLYEAAPNIKRAYIDVSLVPPTAQELADRHIDGIVAYYDGAQNQLQQNPSYIQEFTDRGMGFDVWGVGTNAEDYTVDGTLEKDASRSIKQGVSGIITDELPKLIKMEATEQSLMSVQAK